MMACVLRFRILALVVVCAGAPGMSAPVPEARSVVVVYNSADPDSHALAIYYAQKRGIPGEQVVGIRCSLQEEIERADYQVTIAGPLDRTFRDKGWWRYQDGRLIDTSIRYLAIIRGVPLKIRASHVPTGTSEQARALSRDEASVDSELSALGTPAKTFDGPRENPLFERVTPANESLIDPGYLVVSRLDAPTPLAVRAMIDNALAAEASGLWGWAYVDTRSTNEPGYKEGDEWLAALAGNLRARGVPVLWEKSPETIPSGYPVTDACVYYGWYAGAVNGPFAETGFRFRPGAVAVHLHSFSASTLRDPYIGWCGPIIERGAAATLGNVYEPYLTLTARLDTFQQRLMAGYTLAESASMATRAISWMSVCIGDPLYRPYRAFVKNSAKDGGPWATYRDIVLRNSGNVTAAAAPLAAAAKDTGNSMFLESLGAAQADAGDLKSSLATVNAALAMKNPPVIRFRLSLEKLGLFRGMGQTDSAKKLLMDIIGEPPTPAASLLLETIRLQLYPPPPPPKPRT